MPEYFANGSQTTLSSSITSGSTSVVVVSAAGITTGASFRIGIDSELMLVTNVSGTTLTVTRGIEGTVAAAHTSGATVQLYELTFASLVMFAKTYAPVPATLVVAASNSKNTNRADYFCTGIGDQGTINAALAALPTNAAGSIVGKVLLLEGDYYLSSTISVRSFQSIVGLGWGTVLHLSTAANCYAVTFVPDATGTNNAKGIEIGEMLIDGNCYNQNGGAAGGTLCGGINALGANRCNFSHLSFASCYTAGIDFQQNTVTGSWPWENWVGNACLFSLGKDSGDHVNSGFGIALHDAEENYIVGNAFEFNGKAHLMDNVVGNNYIGANSFVNGTVGIWTGGSRGRYVDNVFDSLSGPAIRCGGNNNHVRGNSAFLIGQGAGAGTADGITLNWGASGNLIEENVLISHGTNGQTRYLINDNADGGNNTVGNIIRNNMLVQGGTLSGGLMNATQVANIYSGNKGYNSTVSPWTKLSEDTASGLATIAASTTSIIVTHGMGVIPAFIHITPRGNIGACWPSAIGATTFTINCATAPGSATGVNWRATLSSGV